MIKRLKTPRGLAATAAVAMLATVTAGCATETTETESGAKVIKDGKLTVCTSLPYEPFEFKKGSDIVGFDMEMMDLIAKENDLEREMEITGFEGIQSGQALNSGTCDIAAAGMTITPEREKAIDFSDPYFDATQALMVKDQNIKTLDDLKGKKLAVMSGTTGEKYAEENAPEGVEIKSFEDLGLQTQAIDAGQVDAVIQDNGPLLDYAKKHKGLYVTAEFDTGEAYGFGVKKDGNDKLLESVNKVIEDAKSDGTYDKVYKKWFGKAPAKTS